MGKKLVIAGADFSQNAVEYSEMELPLITSAQNQRAYLREQQILPEYLVLTSMNIPDTTWYSYVVDVSSFVGNLLRVSSVNGYAEVNKAYGGFMASLADKFKVDGFYANDPQYTNIEPMGIPVLPVLEISQDDDNVFVTKEYIVPEGANYLVFTCKTSALQEGEIPKVVVMTFN